MDPEGCGQTPKNTRLRLILAAKDPARASLQFRDGLSIWHIGLQSRSCSVCALPGVIAHLDLIALPDGGKGSTSMKALAGISPDHADLIARAGSIPRRFAA